MFIIIIIIHRINILLQYSRIFIPKNDVILNMPPLEFQVSLSVYQDILITFQTQGEFTVILSFIH